MKRKIVLIILFVAIFVLALSGCTSNNPTSTNTTKLEEKIKEKDAKIAQLEDEKEVLEGKVQVLEKTDNQSASVSNKLLSTSLAVVQLIKDEDMKGLSSYVHPSLGVRFSPYGNINLKSDQVFTAQQVIGLMENTQSYLWGNYDGSGDPIQLDFNSYYNKFVYDKDFNNPHMIGNNVALGQGNTLDNMKEAYPNGNFVEFYFTGFDPQYGGIDWRSLKLVFEDVDGTWYLVGIVHGEWTI